MAPTDDRSAAPRPPRPHFAPPSEATTLDFPWAYPDVPPGTGDGFDLIRTSSRFAADALRRAGVRARIVVEPPPVSREDFERPAWDPAFSASIDCRHLAWGGPPGPATAPLVASPPRKGPAKRLVSRVYRKVYPRLSPEAIERVARAKAIAAYFAARPSPKRVAVAVARAVYWRFIRRWLNQDAIAQIGRAKRLARARAAAQEPPPPSAPLLLRGLVYSAAVDPLDPAHNHGDLLTAFLLAFRTRADATLVVEVVGDPARRSTALATLRDDYLRLQLDGHHCRVAVIAEDLDPGRAETLRRASTYFVSASRAEARPLPYYSALAGGRPALAPDHTAFGDTMAAGVGFVLGSSAEPAPWPDDPSGPLATTWNRLVWPDLREAFAESAAVASADLPRYRGLAMTARRRLADLMALEAAADRVTVSAPR